MAMSWFALVFITWMKFSVQLYDPHRMSNTTKYLITYHWYSSCIREGAVVLCINDV